MALNQDVLYNSIDKTQIPPLHQKRILAFVNHFVISSCSFLNDFASKCETKFIEVERKMQKVEASLIIIEAKLSSIPGLTEPTKPPTDSIAEVCSEERKTENPVEEVETNTEEDTSPPEKGVKACDDVRYKKFFKMLHFGVPANAVKIKMQTEGVDPAVLDSPDLVLADGIQS